MQEIITTELKSDLERIYKIAGDLLNDISASNIKIDSENQKMMDHVKESLMDITGTLQKDIFNCDYIVTKIKTTRL